MRLRATRRPQWSAGLVTGVVSALLVLLVVPAPAPAGYALITKWGSPGAANGQFDDPQSVATDPAGNVYVADTLNDRIQKFDANGAFLVTVQSPVLRRAREAAGPGPER